MLCSSVQVEQRWQFWRQQESSALSSSSLMPQSLFPLWMNWVRNSSSPTCLSLKIAQSSLFLVSACRKCKCSGKKPSTSCSAASKSGSLCRRSPWSRMEISWSCPPLLSQQAMCTTTITAPKSTLSSTLLNPELMTRQLPSMASTFYKATRMEPSKSANTLTLTMALVNLKTPPPPSEQKVQTQKSKTLKIPKRTTRKC